MLEPRWALKIPKLTSCILEYFSKIFYLIFPCTLFSFFLFAIVIQHLGPLNWSPNSPLFAFLVSTSVFLLYLFPQYFQFYMEFFILSLSFLTAKSSAFVISLRLISDNFSEVFLKSETLKP